MTFEEKMRRNSPEDQIEIGQIVDVALKGNFGFLLKAIVEDLRERKIVESERDSSIPADRIVGWVQALSKLTESLDTAVDIKNQLVAEKREKEEVKPPDEAPKG